MGFLTTNPEDDYRIAAMPGTTQVPGPGALEGSLTAIPKGVVTGVADVGRLAHDVFGADKMLGAGYRADLAGPDTDILAQGAQPVSMFPGARDAVAGLGGADSAAGQLVTTVQAGLDQAEAARKVAVEWGATGEDPRKTGAIGRILAGSAEGITVGAIGSVAGPYGAAGLLGATMGYKDYLQGKQAGLDDDTALERAGVTGAFSAATAFIPMKFGKTAMQSVLGGSAVSLVAGGVQRGVTSAVLDANGYTDMAKQYRVFDGEAMAADAITGLAFGAMGHFWHRAEAPQLRADPAAVDAALAVLTEEHFNRAAPGVPVDPSIANLHGDMLTSALRSLAEGDLPGTPDAATAQKLVDGVLPDPVNDAAKPLPEAAQMTLPGFEEAVADIPRQAEPAPREPGEPLAEPARTEGQPTPAPIDDIHNELLQNLVQQHGETLIPQEDGSVKTLRQLAEELQAQRFDADTEGRLHDVAAACAIRLGATA